MSSSFGIVRRFFVSFGMLQKKHNPISSAARTALIVFALHVIVGAAYHLAGAVPTDQFFAGEAGEWHLMPADLLQDDLFGTLYDLHAQPPLYNLYAGLFAKAFFPNHLYAMVWPQLLMGGLIAAACALLLAWWTGRPRLAMVAGCLLALNSALFLYEPLGYEMLTVLGLTLTVLAFAVHDRSRRSLPLILGIGALTLTTLTRSAYHPILLAPVLAIACVAAKQQWRRVLVVGLIMALLPLAWCAKNQARFGFFGMSSWAGQNIWKIASLNYEPTQLDELAEQGVIEREALEVSVFHLPSDYRPLGFVTETGRTALDRNNRNNINIIAVSQLYGRNAVRLIRYDPAHYTGNVLKAYRLFCQPTANAFGLGDNTVFRAHNWVVSEIVHGRLISRIIKRITGQDPLFTFWLVFLPVLLVGYGVRTVRDHRAIPWVMHVAALLVAYTIIVSCLCEYGENDRFKFAIEPILWVFSVAVLFPKREGDALH